MKRYILFFILISMQGAILLAEESKKSTLFEKVDDRANKLKELLEYKTPQSLLQKIEGLLLNSKFLEVYPHYNSPRHNQTLDNIIDGKDHRGTTCSICSKTFEEIGNRVNLVCGHDICSNCLYVRKYQNHCHECPDQKCKQHINNADFSIQHLKNDAAIDIKLLNLMNQFRTESGKRNLYPNIGIEHLERQLARLERQEISIPKN